MSFGVEMLGALVSLLLPFGLGLCLATVFDRRGHLGWGERIGVAYPCGAILVTLTMCVLSLTGVQFTRTTSAVVIGAALGALAWLAAKVPSPARRHSSVPRSAGKWITALLTALLFSKVVFVAVEVLRRPLTGWDSFAVWALRAKVWAARGSLVLDPRDPFYLGSGARLDYPPHVSLLQAWTAIWLGSWNDVLVNLPWAAYYLSAIVLLYATVALRIDRFLALVAAFCLAGLPLFVVHASIAGYAELMLSVHFLAAVVMIHVWTRERSRAGLLLGLFFTLALPYTKLDGIPLAVACVGVVTMQVRMRHFPLRTVLLALTLVAALCTAWLNRELRTYLASFAPHPEAIVPFVTDLFGSGSWHLLWLFFVTVTVLRLRAFWGTPLVWLWANVAAPVAVLLFLFLFTSAARFAVLRTADSRLFLGLAPAALYFVIVAVAQALSERREPQVSSSDAAGTMAPTTP